MSAVGRSHPPSLIRLAERLIRDEALIARGDVVLCACSGGPDSTALLHVLGRLRSQLHFDLVAHGVDHGLRAEASEELALAGRVAAKLGVPFAVTRVDVSPGGNLQARARDARRAALGAAAIAAGARAIATGHTADDRAETVLMRLLRGSGPEGLAALPPSATMPLGASDPAAKPGHEATRERENGADAAAEPGHGAEREGARNKTNARRDGKGQPKEISLIRPLLLARRSDVKAHLARHAIDVAEDPSNQDARFLRVRVRHELLPLMESMSPGIVGHLCALAAMLEESAPELENKGALRGMGRAQRLAVARAKKCERPVKLRLSGGREVTVGFSGDAPVLMGDERSPARRE